MSQLDGHSLCPEPPADRVRRHSLHHCFLVHMCVDKVRVSVRDMGSTVWVHLPKETGTNLLEGLSGWHCWRTLYNHRSTADCDGQCMQRASTRLTMQKARRMPDGVGHKNKGNGTEIEGSLRHAKALVEGGAHVLHICQAFQQRQHCLCQHPVIHIPSADQHTVNKLFELRSRQKMQQDASC